MPNNPVISGNSRVITTPFGAFNDGQNAQLYHLKNRQGLEIAFTDLGATIVELWTPDRYGTMADIVLGYTSPQDYFEDEAHMGAIAGRYAGRITHGSFMLEGQKHQLSRNIGKHHLHGGHCGFNRKLWQTESFISNDHSGLRMSYLSSDGEEGYPGNLHAGVTYTLFDDNSLVVDYEATTDKTTVINLTQHSYFNLSGNASHTVEDHQLIINAECVLQSDDMLMPTGALLSTINTPLDFKTTHDIGERIHSPSPLMQYTMGYDHTYALSMMPRDHVEFAARLTHPESGRVLEVLTDQPALQVYTSNSLAPTVAGKNGIMFGRHKGVCLETQNYPDAPNNPNFPSATLKAGDRFKSRTIFRFGLTTTS